MKILDTKSIATDHAPTIAKFVHEYTLKGYVPMENQCVRQFGNIVICMSLYDKDEGVVNESVEERTIPNDAGKADSSNAGGESKGQDSESEKETESAGKGTSGESGSGEESGSNVGEKPTPEPETKPAPKRTRAKKVV